MYLLPMWDSDNGTRGKRPWALLQYSWKRYSPSLDLKEQNVLGLRWLEWFFEVQGLLLHLPRNGPNLEKHRTCTARQPNQPLNLYEPAQQGRGSRDGMRHMQREVPESWAFDWNDAQHLSSAHERISLHSLGPSREARPSPQMAGISRLFQVLPHSQRKAVRALRSGAPQRKQPIRPLHLLIQA